MSLTRQPPTPASHFVMGVVRMRTVHERCSALDVHKKTVVACAITAEGQETATFGTMGRGHGEHRGPLEADLHGVGRYS
jgi:hypothetical protein